MTTSKIFRVSAWKVLAGRQVELGHQLFSRRQDALEAHEAYVKPRGVRAPVRVVFTSADLRSDGIIIYTMYVDEYMHRVLP